MNLTRRNLMIPLWELYEISSLDEAVFNLNSSEYLKNSYSLKERKNIYNSLKWAELNPKFNFGNIMKDAPVVGNLKFTNEEVYQYLKDFKSFMENNDHAPNGFSRKVVSFSINKGNNAVIETKNASVEEALSSKIVNEEETKLDSDTSYTYTFQPQDLDKE